MYCTVGNEYLQIIYPNYSSNSDNSCDRWTRSKISFVFLGHEANDQLVSIFHVSLRASRAALPKSTSKFSAKRNPSNVIEIAVAVKIKNSANLKIQQKCSTYFFRFVLKNSPFAIILSSHLSKDVTCLQPAFTWRLCWYSLWTFKGVNFLLPPVINRMALHGMIRYDIYAYWVVYGMKYNPASFTPIYLPDTPILS